MGIIKANLPQHRCRESNRIDFPVALNRRHVLELPVVRLQPAPVFLKERNRIIVRRRRTIAAGPQSQPVINLEVRREENAILMLDEEAADFFGIVPADFRNARRQVSHHVRIFIERLVHPFEVLGVVGEVDADEGRLRMARDHAVKRAQQRFVRRILVCVAKPPGRVVLQFLPTLVRWVVREPERLWIGDVNRDRHAQVAAPFPDRVELGIINPDEFA